MAKHAEPASIFSWAFLALGLVLFALAGVGWSNHLSDEGLVVADNVRLAGRLVEGMSPEQVTEAVSERAGALLGRELTIDYGSGQVVIPYGNLGFSYGVEVTVDRALAARHEGSVWKQFSAWAVADLIAAEVEEAWSFDREVARVTVDDHPGLTPVVVEEPAIIANGTGRLVVVPGVVGTEADVGHIVEQLGSIDLIDAPDHLVTDVEEIHPTVPDEDADRAAAELNAVTADGAGVSINGLPASVPARSLQSALNVEASDGEVTSSFDGEALQAIIENTFVGPVGPFAEPVFEVDGDEVRVTTPGEPPPVCCRQGSGQWLGEQILGGVVGPFALPPRPTDDPLLVAWADGSAVVEKVSEFTTPHACCETRVQNIHRIADIVRGAYLVPGETLSLNEFVGPRTVENGFKAAGAIRQGHLIQEVGGGVSQFATTIFNAAYFAGMDFEEYRSHSIYFSRYPYGREATISSPAPDLAMTNTTEYPILIWTSYTDQSITVSMYSTKHIGVAELGQRSSRRGACTHVETDRERTYPDGHKVVDTFVADYRPAEGIDCNGNRIPPPA
ncbi:MAG: VanW family protein [Acidimicrobiia bacterium]